MKTFELMLVLRNRQNLEKWLEFAIKLLPPNGEVHLRGLVVIEAEKSLSEGAIAAREWRDSLNLLAQDYIKTNESVQVYVDYQPYQQILEEIQEHSIDLLVLEWGDSQTFHVEEMLQIFPCSLVIVNDIEAVHTAKNVLLALRGGPNLSLGTHVAKTIVDDGNITFFHAIAPQRVAPDFKALMTAVPQISRVITAVTNIVDGLVRESSGHDVIVMGAGSRKTASASQAAVFSHVYERSHKPIVLVRTAQQESFAFHKPQFFNREEEAPSVRVDRWFAENSFHSSEFSDLLALMALKEKQGLSISLVLPTLNEAETIGNVIDILKTKLMDEIPLLDEIVLIDSASTDNTIEIAESCGIPSFIHQEILTEELGSYEGKGEALWKSLYVTKGDIIMWVDTDITNMHPRFIYGLLGPLLKHPHIQYVKGYYARPIEHDGSLKPNGGGRVTELVARPMLNLFYPELSGIIQPLSGEYAGRRSAFEQIPFFSGYGVETGLLIDILDRFGLGAIAQNDLEIRVHHNQPLVNLSKMSFAILQVLMARLENRYGIELLDKARRSMKLVVQEPDRFALDNAEIGDYERPPMLTVAAYQEKHGKSNF